MSDLRQLHQLSLRRLFPRPNSQRMWVIYLINYGSLTRSVYFVEVNDSLEVDLLLMQVLMVTALHLVLVVVLVPGFQGVLVKLVEFVVCVLVDVYHEVEHPVENLLINNGISGLLVNVTLGHFGPGVIGHGHWHLAVSLEDAELFVEEP